MSNTSSDQPDQKTRSSAPKRTPFQRVPYISDAIAKHYDAYCAVDTRYRRAQRVLAALWLRDQNIPNAADDQRGRHLGSYLRVDAAEAGRNFVSNDVHMLALRELLLCEDGALMDCERLLECAISSTPLSFNLIGPLALNLELASAVFQQLLPDFVHTVEQITFEHSPARRGSSHKSDLYLADRSSFDCVARVITPEGTAGSVFIECKLSEDMRSSPPARWRDRYTEALKQVGLFKDPDSMILRSPACEQLTREHCLARLAVMNGDTPRAVFMAIAPRLNRLASAAFQVYANELLPIEDDDATKVPFQPVTLEAFIDAIDMAGDQSTADKLWARYCDFQHVYDAALAVIAAKAPDNEPSGSVPAAPAGTDKGKRRLRKTGSRIKRTSTHSASASGFREANHV